MLLRNGKSLEWIQLVQNSVHRLAALNTVIDVCVFFRMRDISCPDEQLSLSHKVSCSEQVTENWPVPLIEVVEEKVCQNVCLYVRKIKYLRII
jgi:nitrate reductase beta subunit